MQNTEEGEGEGQNIKLIVPLSELCKKAELRLFSVSPM